MTAPLSFTVCRKCWKPATRLESGFCAHCLLQAETDKQCLYCGKVATVNGYEITCATCGQSAPIMAHGSLRLSEHVKRLRTQHPLSIAKLSAKIGGNPDKIIAVENGSDNLKYLARLMDGLGYEVEITIRKREEKP